MSKFLLSVLSMIGGTGIAVASKYMYSLPLSIIGCILWIMAIKILFIDIPMSGAQNDR